MANQSQGTQQGRSAQKVRDDASQVAHDVGEAAREQYEHLKDTAQEYIDQGRERAGEYVEQGRDMASQYIDEGRQRALDLTHSLEQHVREQPMRAVLTAAGIGFVVGLLFMRR